MAELNVICKAAWYVVALKGNPVDDYLVSAQVGLDFAAAREHGVLLLKDGEYRFLGFSDVPRVSDG